MTISDLPPHPSDIRHLHKRNQTRLATDLNVLMVRLNLAHSKVEHEPSLAPSGGQARTKVSMFWECWKIKLKIKQLLQPRNHEMFDASIRICIPRKAERKRLKEGVLNEASNPNAHNLYSNAGRLA